MKHQPFETWIFDDEALGSAEQHELKAHLGECDACRSLFEADRSISRHIQHAGSIAPAIGFRDRFEYRLQEERNTRRMIKTLILAAFVLAVLLAAVLLMGGFLFTRYVPFTRAVTGFGQILLQVVVQGGIMVRILGMVGGAFLTTLPQSILFAASIAGMGLTSLWLFSLYHFSSSPVRR